jgi:hypothetical protein
MKFHSLAPEALSRDYAPWPLSLRLVTTDAKSLATAMAT